MMGAQNTPIPTADGSVMIEPRCLAGRRILFFAGLVHHYQRLAPLLTRLDELGANVICATTQNVNFGCDFKGDFEVPLVQAGKRYIFLPEYFEAEVADDLVLDYRRAEQAIGEAVRSTPQWSTRLPVAAVRLRTMIGLEHDRLVRKLLDHVDPELVLVLHEYNCWARPLCAQAIARDIPVLSFIEGVPYETLPQGMLNGQLSSRICLWGQAHYRRMVADGAEPAKLAIIGAMHLDVVRNTYLAEAKQLRAQFDLSPEKKIILLLMPRLCYLDAADQIMRALTDFVRDRRGYQFVIKWHSHDRIEDIDRLCACVNETKHFQFENTLQLIACADVVLCSGTMAGTEALAFGKPLIEINWQGRNININYSARGIAQEVCSPQGLPLIDEIITNGRPKPISEAVEKFVADTFSTLDGRSVDRAVGQVLSLLNPCTKS
jgi:hypothetical protein